MDKIIFRQLCKWVLIFSAPITVFLIIIKKNEPILVLGFILGILIGSYKLYTFFACIQQFISGDENNRSLLYISLLKYVLSLSATITILAITLYKSVNLGIYLTLGVLLVSVILMIYTFMKGLLKK